MVSIFSVLISLLLLSSVAVADPFVSVDADPATPGIQADATTALGTVEIDLVITGVDAEAPLNGFELDLVFDSAVLSAEAVIDGGFLLDPVMVVEQALGLLRVEFAEVTLGPQGAFGEGLLATVIFETVAPGLSLLTLENVILAAPFGTPIPVAGLDDGSIEVPEPAGVVLSSTAVLCLMVLRRWAMKQQGRIASE